MSDNISTLLQILLMAAGGHGSDWGDQTNTNLQKLEAAISGQTALTLSGGSYTLSDDEARASTLKLTGTLAANQTIVVPARTKPWIIVNLTSGSFTTTLQVNGGSSITVPANSSAMYYSDGGTPYSVAPVTVPTTGEVKAFAGSSAPLNHLLCYGQAVSRTTYAALFAIIGTTYGTGDGSTTFNLPDLRGRAIVGLDNMGGSAAGRLTSVTSTLGSTGGEQSHVLLTSEIPAHNHGVTDPGHAHAITDPGHTHGIATFPSYSGVLTGSVNVNLYALSPAAPGSALVTTSSTTGVSVNGAGTGISIQNAGGGGAHNNVQPMIFLNHIIRI